MVFFFIHKRVGGSETGSQSVWCDTDGDHWQFGECSAQFVVTFMHVFTTMQCGTMARVVFIRTIKKVEADQSFVRLETSAMKATSG